MRGGFGLVANAAVDQLEIAPRGVPGSAWIQVAVAVNSRLPGVHGSSVDRDVHISRYRLVATGSGEVRIVVTPQAAIVVLGEGARCAEKEYCGGCDESVASAAAAEERRTPRARTHAHGIFAGRFKSVRSNYAGLPGSIVLDTYSVTL